MLMQPTGLDTGQRSRKLIRLMFYRGLFLLLQVFLIAVMIAPILTNSASPWWFDNLLGLQIPYPHVRVSQRIVGQGNQVLRGMPVHGVDICTTRER